MANRYLGGERPAPRSETESPLGNGWPTALERYGDAIEGCLLHDALGEVLEFVGGANKVVDAEQPWDLAKAAKAGDEAAGERLRGVLGDLVEACRLIAPRRRARSCPTTAPRVLEQLGYAYPYGPDGNGGPPLLDELRWGAHAGEPGTLTEAGTALPTPRCRNRGILIVDPADATSIPQEDSTMATRRVQPHRDPVRRRGAGEALLRGRLRLGVPADAGLRRLRPVHGRPGELGGGARQARRVGRRDDVRNYIEVDSIDDAVTKVAASSAARIKEPQGRRSRAWAGSPSCTDSEGNPSSRLYQRRCPASSPSPTEARRRQSADAPRRQPLPSPGRPLRRRRRPGHRRGARWRASSGSSSRAGTSSRARRALELVDRFPWLDAAVGVHPHDAAKVDDAAWADDRGARRATRGSSRSARPASTTTGSSRRSRPSSRTCAATCALAARDRQAGDPPLPIGGRAARRPGRAARRARGRSAATPPPVARSTRSPARSTTPRRCSTSAPRSRSRACRSGRGEEATAEVARLVAGGPAARRDRFAVPLAARRTAPPQRAGVGQGHGRLGRRRSAARTATRSATSSSRPTTRVFAAGARSDGRTSDRRAPWPTLRATEQLTRANRHGLQY